MSIQSYPNHKVIETLIKWKLAINWFMHCILLATHVFIRRAIPKSTPLWIPSVPQDNVFQTDKWNVIYLPLKIQNQYPTGIAVTGSEKKSAFVRRYSISVSRYKTISWTGIHEALVTKFALSFIIDRLLSNLQRGHRQWPSFLIMFTFTVLATMRTIYRRQSALLLYNSEIWCKFHHTPLSSNYSAHHNTNASHQLHQQLI